VIRNGLSTHFWHDPWCGNLLLRARFGRLFRLSLQQGGRVGELGSWEGSVWVWDLRWRRPLFVWETELLNQLLLMVTSPSRVDREDKWTWTLSPDGRYSVKSACSSLLRGLPAVGAPKGDTLQAVSRVWKSLAPSKVAVFSWQLLLDRIPTRINLVRRGIPLPEGDWGVRFVRRHLNRRSTFSFRAPRPFRCGIR
jgi:hypothetical protein